MSPTIRLDDIGGLDAVTDNASTYDQLRRLQVISIMDYLSESTPFEKLSVTAICKQADMSRTSFYRLFSDKYSAVNWYVGLVSLVGHVQVGRTLSWHDASVITLSGLSMMRRLLMGTGGGEGYESSMNTGISLRESSLTKTLTQYRRVKMDDELRFQVKFFARAEVPLVREWYRDVDAKPLEEMVAHIESCVPHRLHDLLALPSDPTKGVPLTYSRLVALVSSQDWRDANELGV